jgi:hypothetical protein
MCRISDERTKGREFDGQKGQLQLVIRNFLIQCAEEEVKSCPGFYLAEDVLNFANASGELERRFPSTKALSEAFSRHGLLADRKRVDIQAQGAKAAAGMPSFCQPARIQRTAFRFVQDQL